MTPDAGRDLPGWGWRQVCSLAAIVVVLETLALSYPMMATASPAIITRFHTAHGGWLMTSFLLVGATTAPLIGKLADLYGKRRMLLICLALSSCGALISAIASTFVILLAGRCLFGLLVATVFLSYSLIRDVFPPKTVAVAVSVAAASSALIAIPAPFLTEWLLDSYDFRSVFWLLLILLGISAAAVALTTDESRVRLPLRVGVVGAVLLGAGLAAALLGVSSGPIWGWAAVSTLSLLVGGVALIAIWVATARATKDALIDIEVWRRRSVLLTAIAAGCAYGVSGLYTMLLPMLAMTPTMLGLGYGFGVDAQGFAVFLVPIGVLSEIGGLIVGVLVGHRIAGPRLTSVLGMIAAGAGSVLTAYSHDDKGMVLIFAGLVGFGLGLAYASTPNLLIEAVSPKLQASTASLIGVFQTVIPAILPVVVFAVLNNSYTAALPPMITQMLGGAIIYTDAGFKAGFLIVAAIALLGFVAALLLPRTIEEITIEAVTSGSIDAETES
ncbi:MFS transporter [Nocardia sp. NPDC051990]|uniref:MFS transporter n=1 Tax=Nocardia sp. NPDC051990 TaxID=3155285 RepID=UPI00342A84EA